MAAKDDGENSREEGDQRIMDNTLQAVHKKTGKGKWSVRMGQIGTQRRTQVAKMQIVWVFSWQKGNGKKGGKGQEKRGNGDSRACWDV